MAETKEAIIKMGDELIRQKGYNAFSYHNIAQPLGIKNAAIHYYFPTKTDLLTAIIKHHIHKVELFEQEVAGFDEYKQVEAFAKTYKEIEGQKRVCFVGAMATDWDTVDDVVKPYMQQMTGNILQWLTHTLEKGKKKKTIQFAEPAQTKALLIVSNLLAATQLARITGSDNFDAIEQAILNGLKP